MIQYLAAWFVIRRLVNILMELLIVALFIRVGVYWSQHNTLPPFSLIVDDATTLWLWLDSTGVVQWIVEILNRLNTGG